MKLVKFLQISATLFLFVTELSFAWQPKQIVVFGDSLSDNGNKYQAYQTPLSPPYWHGRYSNGPVWVEHLAFQFNLIPNPLLEPDYPRNIALRDYAMGDAVASDKNLSPSTKTRTLMQQLKEYQSQNHDNPRDTLVIIWIGANDFKTKTCIDSPFSCTKNVIHVQEKFINSLYEFGLRHFLILSVPNLAITPQAHENFDKPARIVLSGLIRYYNNNLALLISQLQNKKSDLNIVEFDIRNFLNSIKHNFKQPIYQACYANQSVYTKMMAEPCPADIQNHYLFWDNTHPSAAAHALLANQVYDALKEAR
jgi:phospholipase/lecithinase/hemolysin